MAGREAGYRSRMSDDTSEGAVPVEDAAVDDPPTVDEVLDEQRRRDDLPDPSDDPSHIQVDDTANDTANDTEGETANDGGA